MDVFRIPAMNRTRLTVIGILLLVGHPYKFAYGEVPPQTAVPLPCSESFVKFGTEYNACNNLFGKCGITGTTASPSDYVSTLIDLLVRDLVLVEMQGLYKGVDTYSNGSNPTQLRPKEFVGDLPTGKGTCSTVGACNLFCGEGYTGSSTLKVVMDQVTNPSLGSQGYVPGVSKEATSGKSPGNTMREPERLLQGTIPKTFEPKSFLAKGVVEQYYDLKS
ncbi:MAG: hypothetical protein ABI041_00570, partial [Bdellovibrionia bacterium]